MQKQKHMSSLTRRKYSNRDTLEALDALDEAIDKCVTIRVGIADNYFYRSLYAAQLHNCFKYLPPENFLLLPSEHLMTDPSSTVAKVLEFLGLSMHPSVAALVEMQNQDQNQNQNVHIEQEKSERRVHDPHLINLNATFISEAVRRHFPKFELTTGWASVGKYKPLSPLLEGNFRRFLEPYNNLLWSMLGSDWTVEWSDANTRA